MPLSLPAFDQYQQPLIPLRGLWNATPPEGDKYVNAEIDWLSTTKSNAVQFSLSGNSPVSLSQIVALCVDNSRSGADVDFVFPDSGFVLAVPAHTQLVSPVFTNALMFYASSPSAIAGDVTVFQILNSMPPPIPIAPSTTQNTASLSSNSVVNGNYQLIAPGINGTINALSLNLAYTSGASAGQIQIQLVDGNSKICWSTFVQCPASTSGTIPFNVPGLDVRFTNGLKVVVAGSNLASGWIMANAYYSTP